MSLREWWSRMRGSLRGDDALEREMNQEIQFHLDMAARRNVERGMTPVEATRQAKLTFGSAESVREEGREAHRARVMESLVADVRYALRGLRRSPSFTIAAILTVALGIGASTAMFTVVNAVLLRPMPIPRPEDVFYIGWVWAKGGEIPSLSAFQYEFVRARNRAFEAVATYGTDELQLGNETTAQPLRGLRVSGDFFGVIGIRPRLGRAFDAREMATGDSSVVILGHDTWRSRFGGDTAVLGRQVLLDRESRTVIGILPPEFQFPAAPLSTGFVVPLLVHANPDDEGHNSNAIGRVREGTSPEARAAEVQALSDAFRAAHPRLAPAGEGFKLFSHTEAHVGRAVRHTLWVLLGAVLLVLLIACANTATLLLARAWARQREIAVRASLGAGPGRIIQQLLTEGVVLSAVAATIGVFFSVAAVRSFVALAPNVLPAGLELGIDGRVLAYAIVASMITGLLFGLAAGIPALRTRLQSVLQVGARGASGGTRVREALVFLQTAIAVVLLAGATLLTASFARLIRVDPGFDVERVTAVRLGRLPAEYDESRRAMLVDRLLERIRAIPGVERAAAAPNLPLERGLNFPVDIPENPDRAVGAVELRHVSLDYLATLGVPLRGGRDFDKRDAQGAEPVAIVNEAFARHFWGSDVLPSAAVGRAIRIGHFKDRWTVGAAAQHETRVIGVAADIHEMGLHRPAKPTVLVPQASWGTPILLVRGQSAALTDALRTAVVAEEPRLAPTVEPLSSVVSRSVAAPRFRTMLVGSFAIFALLLAGVGIYGVIASVVQQRQREIGIRIALGATRASVSTVVVRRCLMNVTAGAVVGLVAFLAARQVLAAWLFGITPGDPRVLGAAMAVLAVVALLASWIPARRAAHIDPATALRLD